jgi:hypothetical protein
MVSKSHRNPLCMAMWHNHKAGGHLIFLYTRFFNLLRLGTGLWTSLPKMPGPALHNLILQYHHSHVNLTHSFQVFLPLPCPLLPLILTHFNSLTCFPPVSVYHSTLHSTCLNHLNSIPCHCLTTSQTYSTCHNTITIITIVPHAGNADQNDFVSF